MGHPGAPKAIIWDALHRFLRIFLDYRVDRPPYYVYHVVRSSRAVLTVAVNHFISFMVCYSQSFRTVTWGSVYLGPSVTNHWQPGTPIPFVAP
jgi:hypothetical protein